MAVALGRRAAAPALKAATAPPPASPPPRRRSSAPPALPLPLPELVRLVRRADGRGGRLPPGPRELALLTSQIMGARAGGGGGGAEGLQGAASAAAAPASEAPTPTSAPRRSPPPPPASWRRLYALFAEFSDVLNAVHVAALLTALPRAAAAAAGDDTVDGDGDQDRLLLAAFGAELLELACQLLPSGGAGARELVACACGCARLWGRTARSTAPAPAPPPPSSARRLMQIVTARARPAFLADGELAALGWSVAELGFPPPRQFVADYASAARGRLKGMRAGELCQVGRALALMAASAGEAPAAAAAEAGGSAQRVGDGGGDQAPAAAAAATPAAVVSMVPPSWVEEFARACEARAPLMDARDVAGAMWAAAALARRVDGPGADNTTAANAASPSSSSSSSPPALPALADALLLRAAEVAGDLEDRHVATLLWACGAFATAAATGAPASSSSSSSSFPSFHAPTALPLSWRRFEAVVLDGRWPDLLRRSPSPSHALRHASVALVASARLGLAAADEEGEEGEEAGSPPRPFRWATLAAAQAGLASAAAYLAPPPVAADGPSRRDFSSSSSGGDSSSSDSGSSSRSPSPPAPAARSVGGMGGIGSQQQQQQQTTKKPRWAKPAPSVLRDASSVLWALQRDHAARPAAEDGTRPPPPEGEAAAARAARGALAEALALRRRWRARARRRAAGASPPRRRFFGRDGLLRAPPLELRPADLSVSLWSLARLGLLSPQDAEAEEGEEELVVVEEEDDDEDDGEPRPSSSSSSNSSRRRRRRRRLLCDAVAEASELLPLFRPRETAGILLALARARHRAPSPSSLAGAGGLAAGGGEAWGERALVHFASLLPPAAAEAGGGSGGSDSASSSRARLPARAPAPRDLAGAIYGAGAALRAGAARGPAPLPPPAWALRRLAASSRAALPACGAPELVMLLRGFAALRWHPGPAWAAAHARRCMEVVEASAAAAGRGGGGGGGGGFSPRETASLQRAARRLYAVRPGAAALSGSDEEAATLTD